MPNQITIHTRAQWREWLTRNHKSKEQVMLISHKKHTGQSAITHRESVEEAICFGWIDTIMKSLDEDRFGRIFVRRKPGANWSKNTLRYAEEMIAAGKMTPEGMAAYKLGAKKKPIDHDRPTEWTVPEDLALALAKNPAASQGFEAYPPSAKKAHLSWLFNAKKPETREKRIRKMVAAAEKGNRIW